MRACLLLVTSALACMCAQADSLSARIDSSARGYQGNLGVNQAAGMLQQQVNGRVISAGGAGATTTTIKQVIEQLPDSAAAIHTNVSIDGDSFSQGSGVVGVNQAAGAGNQQINVLRVTLLAAPENLDDSVLAQSVTRADDALSAIPAGGERRVEMSHQAFSGSRGVVQLNQSSGIGNRTANHLSIGVVD